LTAHNSALWINEGRYFSGKSAGDWISRSIFGSLGIAVIDQHIWRCGVSRIGNPTYIWRCVTENPREPYFFNHASHWAAMDSLNNADAVGGCRMRSKTRIHAGPTGEVNDHFHNSLMFLIFLI
jgi:hypothetical protein